MKFRLNIYFIKVILWKNLWKSFTCHLGVHKKLSNFLHTRRLQTSSLIYKKLPIFAGHFPLFFVGNANSIVIFCIKHVCFPSFFDPPAVWMQIYQKKEPIRIEFP